MKDLLSPSQVTAETGVSPKTLRGYEGWGLVVPSRAVNGYRQYDRHQITVVRQVRALNSIGIPLGNMAPFVDCLNTGSEYADACPSTLAEYRRAIDRIDRTASVLAEQRDALVSHLSVASQRLMGQLSEADASSPYLTPLPAYLVAPIDDGSTGIPGGRETPPLSSLPLTATMWTWAIWGQGER